MMDISLNLVVIRSTDVQRATQFYKLLGLDFTLHRHGEGPEHYACELGQVVFEIYPSTNEIQDAASVRIGFQVNSLDSLVIILREHQVPFTTQPKDSPWGRRAVITDPDGHRVELVERK